MDRLVKAANQILRVCACGEVCMWGGVHVKRCACVEVCMWVYMRGGVHVRRYAHGVDTAKKFTFKTTVAISS